MSEKEIVVYGTTWCGDCRRSKKVFAELDHPYRWVDVDEDKAAETYVKELNDNMRIVPTIVFPDGTILVEPDDQTLREKLKSL